MLPKLPIETNPPPIFERKYSKEVFPGTELAGIEFVAYPDMICHTQGPVQRSMRWVLDIKTSGGLFDTTPNILSLDQQLRTYAWLTGIPNVGFLNFVKVARAIKTGTCLTLLHDYQDSKAGTEWIVATVAESEDEVFKPDAICVVTTEQYEELKKIPKPTSKQGKLDKINFLARTALTIPANRLTKQKLQFLTAHIDEEAQQEIATQIGREIIEIYHANQEGVWEKRGGIRYPNNKCTTCSMRGICLKNDQLRDNLLVRSDDIFEVDIDR